MTAFDNPTSKRAVIVAHPDDESLWFGGLMIRYPGDWSVICCSRPKQDPIRSLKFTLACAALGARGFVIPETETRDQPLTMLNEIDLTGLDAVVTHNAVGEYGHPHHIQVYQYIANHLPLNIEMYSSGYGRKLPVAAVLTVALTDEEWQKKLAALKCYDNPRKIGGQIIPTWQMLLNDLSTKFDLKTETYARE